MKMNPINKHANRMMPLQIKRLIVSTFVSVSFVSACAQVETMSTDTQTHQDMHAETVPQMDHSAIPGMNHDAMVDMDHSKMSGMEQNAIPEMDHSKMQGMDHSAMPEMNHDATAEMDHSKMQGMDHSAMPGMKHDAMAEMDHSKMQGMDHSAMPGMNHDAMAEMDHSKMQGMDHSAMPGMNHDAMAEMDHSKMQGMDHSAMPGMNHDAMAEMDHSKMQGMDHSAMPGMNHDSMSGMDHGAMQDMNMQGGSAPADARDPHAYSGGYTLDSGPYALPGPRLRMADEHNFSSVLFDRLEAVRTTENTSAAFDVQAWYGRDYDRAILKFEGDYDNHKLEQSSSELLWGHAVTAYWNTELGLRYDHGEGPDRGWLAAGMQGLAPYWFELNATAYIGKDSRSALNIEAEYELLFTQKLILQPRIEADIFGKDDPERGIGSGISEVKAGLRLRYESQRELAPYIGLEWVGKFGGTADLARIDGMDTNTTQLVAGVRLWF